MQKKDFVMHLIGEVASFILEGHPSRMVISLHQEDDGLHLCVIDDHPRTAGEIESIQKSLNSHKRPELAGYYGSMAGHDLLGASRLNLIGWQVKHGVVTPQKGGIKIDLWLGSDRFDPAPFSIPEHEK